MKTSVKNQFQAGFSNKRHDKSLYTQKQSSWCTCAALWSGFKYKPLSYSLLGNVIGGGSTAAPPWWKACIISFCPALASLKRMKSMSWRVLPIKARSANTSPITLQNL